MSRYVDLSQTIFDGLVTYKGLPAPKISDYLSREASRANYAQGTEFQKRAWIALTKIPYGETRSYGQQAHSIGQPAAVRAIGAANGKNPIGIIVPCHRVIGANGSLTGYAGGLHNKEFLLKLEGIV